MIAARIARVRAWLERSGPVPAAPAADELATLRRLLDVLNGELAIRTGEREAARARVRQLENELERTPSQAEHDAAWDQLQQVALHLERQSPTELEQQLASARAEVDRLNGLLSARTAAAAACVCGGDTELYWRGEAERHRRANVALSDQLADARARLDNRDAKIAYRSVR
ncbi:hypothetical protein ABZS66_19025 [Dactylosporangium sp. NPDC005572]|uniref:hypothetical protein n=1 Tax=Dactylosporangium sp. NPDC005572 TaxID=3156889 RepID=UPI0033B28CE5